MTPMSDQNGGDGYVTQIISRKVKPGCQKQYEAWLKDRLVNALSRHAGYEGITILRPGDTPSKEYVIIQRWAGYDELCKWVESDERHEVLAESEPFTLSGPSYRKETGLEVWFQLPGEIQVKPPPRYKMALLIWMVITPLVLAANFATGPLLQSVPVIPAAYLRSAAVVIVMTYFAMPLARKLLARWLDD
jgi:antibiotic biosynthesis monooxygenase (ABM) superfamily enzyme